MPNEHTQQILDSVATDKPSDATHHFNMAIARKMADRLEMERRNVGASFFKGKN